MSMDTSSPPLVSVITPAYNEEQYLAECIESVLAQSYTHWDCLIVNNCSTDGTLAIAQKYAVLDPRIRVISNSTLIPAVANFNGALRRISSESKYCKIVFADDWMFPECLERMVALAEKRPTVGIVAAYGLQGQTVLWQGCPIPAMFFQAARFAGKDYWADPMYSARRRRSYIDADLVRSRDPFYNESNVHAADSEACFELLKGCDFGFIHQILTFSREREGSLFQASRELNASAADLLHEMVAYGPCYLTPDEHAKCLHETLSKYYDFLATSLLQGRGKSFWDYHKGKLKENGIGFSYELLAGALCWKLLRRFRVPSRRGRKWGL